MEYAAFLVTAALLLVYREVRRYQVLQSVTGDMEVVYYSVTCCSSTKVRILTVTGDMQTFLDVWHSSVEAEPHFAPAAAELETLQRTVAAVLDVGLSSPDHRLASPDSRVRDTRRRAEMLSFVCLDAPVTSLDQLYAQVLRLLALRGSKIQIL